MRRPVHDSAFDGNAIVVCGLSIELLELGLVLFGIFTSFAAAAPEEGNRS